MATKCCICLRPISKDESGVDSEIGVYHFPVCPRQRIVSFGGGTNSTAILVGLWERKIYPSDIVFADTGGEKPETYAHMESLSAWLRSVDFPEITIVKGDQPQQLKDGTLENECLRLGALPTKAMGFGGCSMKWKRDPFNKWVRSKYRHIRPLVFIGFDADEPHRAERSASYSEPLYDKSYPLIEWGWGRDECVEAIKRAGIGLPGKSSCFFCPSSKKHEILSLRDLHPDLLERALEIERRAMNGEGPAPKFRGKGLGRNFSWADFLKRDESQQKLFSDFGAPEVDCGCYDGD